MNNEGSLSPFIDDGEGSPRLSIRSHSTSPMDMASAFEEITGEVYDGATRLRTKEGYELGTEVHKVRDSIFKLANRENEAVYESIQKEIALYERLETMDEKAYFLEMKSNKPRGSVVFIELEYLEGMDVTSYLHEKDVSYVTLSWLARSIAYSLKVLAKIGFVHGDLHLANIMIPEEELDDEKPHIKLIDFGNSTDSDYTRFYNLDISSENNYVSLLKSMGIEDKDISQIESIIHKHEETNDALSAYDEIIAYWDRQKGGKRKVKNLPIEYKMAVNKTRKMPAVGTKRCVFNGTAKHTSGGLEKKDLMLHKGRIISRKKHALGKKAFKNLVKAGYKPKKGTFKLFRKHTKGSKKE
jgi:serine/threonine protein kinase